MAVMAAGWPDTVPGGMVSRMCTSGLDALASGAAQVKSGMADLVVAGGAESMSRVPMFSDRPAFALEEPLGELTGFVTIGVSADLTAARHGFTRQDLDAWAVRSHQRAAAAPAWESVVPVRRDGVTLLAADEGARAATTMESLAALPPLFGADPQRVLLGDAAAARPRTRHRRRAGQPARWRGRRRAPARRERRHPARQRP
jgi:acetyl-CoA C-acetyltransferase